jgi:hypothetical protein
MLNAGAISEGAPRSLGGALMIFIGTILAIAAIPFNYQEPLGLLQSSAIMSVALLGPTVFTWKRDLRSLLRGENILMLALVYWVLFEVLQGAFAVQSSRDAVERVFILLGTTGLGFWLGATIGPPWRPRLLMTEAMRPWATVTVFRITVVAFALGIWDFWYRADFSVEAMLSSLFLPRFAAPWQREALGDWSAFSAHLQFFGYTVPALATLCALKAGRFHPYTLITGAMAIVTILVHSQGGGRRILGILILSALFCWLIFGRLLTLRRTVILVGSIVLLLGAMQFMLLLRDVGLGDYAGADDPFGYLHVDGNFVIIAKLLEFVPELYPFVGWEYVSWAIAKPIPRVFWPSKPMDGGFDLAEVMGVPNTSFAISVAGELYLSYGFPAAFVGGVVYGRFATIANSLLEQAESVNPVFPSLALVWLFVGVRSMLEIMILGYALLALIGLGKLAKGVGELVARTPKST